jgi:hypothetical protein
VRGGFGKVPASHPVLRSIKLSREIIQELEDENQEKLWAPELMRRNNVLLAFEHRLLASRLLQLNQLSKELG